MVMNVLLVIVIPQPLLLLWRVSFSQLGSNTIKEPSWWALGRWCQRLLRSRYRHYGNSSHGL